MIARIVVLLLAFIVCSPAWAAVAFSSKGTAECHAASNTVTCATETVGTGLTNPVLVAYVVYSDNTSAATLTATWNGTSMTQVGSVYDTTNHLGTAIFCLAAPATGAQSLVTTDTSTNSFEIHAIAAAFTGANQSTPCKNATSSSNQASPGSLTITSATGDYATAVFTQAQTSGITLNGTTSIVNSDSGPNQGIYAEASTGASTVTLTATAASAKFAGEGVDIAAAGGGSPVHGLIFIDEEEGVFAP